MLPFFTLIVWRECGWFITLLMVCFAFCFYHCYFAIHKSKDSEQSRKVKNIKPINPNGVWLAALFTLIIIPPTSTLFLIIVYSIGIGGLFSQSQNNIYFLFGYKLYRIENLSGFRYFLWTKKVIADKSQLDGIVLERIDNGVWMEKLK